MRRTIKRKLALVVAIAAILAGGAVAALAAGGPHSHSRHAAHGAGHRRGGAMLQTAAKYLGIAPAQIKQELQSGKTLAQLASASGHSEAGLIAALVAAKRARIAALSAHLEERVAAQVRHSHRHGSARRGARAAVRSYLGLTPRQLHLQLRAGHTLAQIANTVPGKSVAGLVQAIVAARQARITAASASGKLTKAQADARTAALSKRVTRMLNSPLRTHATG